MITVPSMNIDEQAANGIYLSHSPSMGTEQPAIIAEVFSALEAGNLDLPTLPDMARKIQDLIDDPNVSAHQVVNLLSADPAVSMHIIRAANSAAFNDGKSVDNLRNAISRLGYRMLRSMVINITMTKLFQAGSPLIHQQLKKLWGHSREVAANCYVLARQQNHLKPDVAMLAGLVHDIGALPIYLHADHHHSRLDQVTLEDMVCKFSSVIGAKLLQSWNFPEELIDVASGHENLQRVNNSGAADYADVVTMANLLHGPAKFIAWRMSSLPKDWVITLQTARIFYLTTQSSLLRPKKCWGLTQTSISSLLVGTTSLCIRLCLTGNSTLDRVLVV